MIALRPAARGLCVALAALVLCLTAFAVSPAAHKAIHSDSGHAEHQCAITLFAHGVEHTPVAVGASWTPDPADVHAPVVAEFARLAEPAHLRPPASGPPVA